MELGLWQTDCPELALPFSRSRAQGSPEGGDHSLAGGARADVARPREPGRWPWSAGAKDPACPGRGACLSRLPLPLPLPGAPGYFQAIFNSAKLPVQKVDRMGVLQPPPCLPFSRGPGFLGGWSFLTLGETMLHS